VCGRDIDEGVRAVVAAVVGDTLDAHPECLEGGERSFQKGRGRIASLVRQRLCIGVSAVIVHGDMDEVVPQAAIDVSAGASGSPGRARTLMANHLARGAVEPRRCGR
jgi:hypothetical protein